jgi:tetratricopeptide (TPR) repeat protein
MSFFQKVFGVRNKDRGRRGSGDGSEHGQTAISVEPAIEPASPKPAPQTSPETSYERALKVDLALAIETEIMRGTSSDAAARAIAFSSRFRLDTVKGLIVDSFFSRFPTEVKRENDVCSVSMKIGVAIGGASFAQWLADNIVAGRQPSQMVEDHARYGRFGMWQDAKAICEQFGVRFQYTEPHPETIPAVPPSQAAAPASPRQVVVLGDIDIRRLMRDGQQFQEAGQFQKAIECFDKIILFAPQADLLYAKGYCQIQIGQLPAGIQCIDQAISLNPKETRFYALKAQALGKLGSGDEALRAISKAIEMSPGEAGCYLIKSEILEGSGHFQEAADVLRSACERFRGNMDAYLSMRRRLETLREKGK